jgi:sulfotransferase
MNIITGLPRSGSTLLCNILNQNPRFWATSTSALPRLCSVIVGAWSTSLEIKGDLNNDRKETENRLHRSLKAFCDAWHHRDDDREVIFDKSRGWAHHLLMLRKIYPESKIIVTIRDLREVYASIEKQHRKNPLFDEANTPIAKTIMGRAQAMFANNGIVGGPLNGIYDIINRQIPVSFIQYEKLVDRPEAGMKELYNYLEEEHFEHNFDDIQNTAIDPDAFYLNKFPHDGSGKIEPPPIDAWKEYVTAPVAHHIMSSHAYFNNFFGYR